METKPRNRNATLLGYLTFGLHWRIVRFADSNVYETQIDVVCEERFLHASTQTMTDSLLETFARPLCLNDMQFIATHATD